MSDDKVLDILTEIRNWTRAAAFASVKSLLVEALPDTKTRAAYQMLDGKSTVRQVRAACKMSPNGIVALAQRCTSMGLMELRDDKKRVRLFDLNDFGLLASESEASEKR